MANQDKRLNLSTGACRTAYITIRWGLAIPATHFFPQVSAADGTCINPSAVHLQLMENLPWKETEYGDLGFYDEYTNAAGQNDVLNNGPLGFPFDGVCNCVSLSPLNRSKYLVLTSSQPRVPPVLQYETGSPDVGQPSLGPLFWASAAVDHTDLCPLRINATPQSNPTARQAYGPYPPFQPIAGIQSSGYTTFTTPPSVQEVSDLHTTWPGSQGSQCEVLARQVLVRTGVSTTASPPEVRWPAAAVDHVAVGFHNAGVPMSLPQHDLSAVQAQNIIAGQVTNSSKRRKGSSAHETPIRALLPRQILYPTTVALQHAIFPTGPDAIRGQAVINGNDDAYYPGQNTGLQLSQIAFPCPKNLCEQSFDTRAELEEHETAHDWEKTHEFPCPISERYPDLCNSEGFQKAVDADRHVAQHFPPQFHCRHGCDNLSYRTDQRVRHEKEFCKLRPQEGAMIPSSAASIAEYSPAAPPTLSQRSRGRVVEPSQAMQRSISELATVHPVYQFPVTPTPLVRRGRKSTPGRPGSTRAPRSAAHSSLARSEPPTVFSTPARQPLSTPLTSYKPIMPAPRTNQGFYSDDPNDPNYFSSPSLPK